MPCGGCRKEYAEAERQPPCETEGLLEDGTCQFGMPSLGPSEAAVADFWGLVNTVGWEMVRDLGDWKLGRHEAADLLLGFAVMKSEEYEIQAEKAKAPKG